MKKIIHHIFLFVLFVFTSSCFSATAGFAAGVFTRMPDGSIKIIDVPGGTQPSTQPGPSSSQPSPASQSPSVGEFVTAPTKGDQGQILTLVGSNVTSGWKIIPDGVGWHLVPGGGISLAPIENNAGSLQITQSGGGTFMILPASGSPSMVSSVQTIPDGFGGWKIIPVTAPSGSGGSTLLPGFGKSGDTLKGAITPSFGEGKGLVPCGTGDVPGGNVDAAKAAAEDCQFEDFIVLAKNLINFLLFTIAVPIAAISFAWAGWLYMSAAGNESKVQEAHKIFGYVVWGLCIALAAWLIVNAIVIGLGVGPEYNFLG